VDTASFLKLKLGLALTDNEQRSLRGAADITPVINDLKRFATV
jgi:hypothetical protein